MRQTQELLQLGQRLLQLAFAAVPVHQRELRVLLGQLDQAATLAALRYQGADRVPRALSPEVL